MTNILNERLEKGKTSLIPTDFLDLFGATQLDTSPPSRLLNPHAAPDIGIGFHV